MTVTSGVELSSRTRRGRSALAMTALAYIPAVLSMMTVGVIVPFIDTLSSDLVARPTNLGLAIALFSLPAAVFATIGGGLIDKFGVRRAMLVEVVTSTIGSVLASQAHTIWWLDMSMVVSGLGFGGMCVTSPCLIIATLEDGSRVRAMSFWSTYAPTGYAAGLLLAAACAAGGNWRLALLAHAGLLLMTFGALVCFVPTLDATAMDRESLRHTLMRIASVLREPRALRLGLAVALPNAVSYGTSIVAPSYLARVHHLSIAGSSASVAGAKITAMAIGGLSMGYLLSRRISPRLLFGIMACVGLAAQILLFLPASSMPVALCALILWIFSFGGLSGGGMTLLPNVAGDAARVGAASGLVNQFISVASFATPSTWLSLHSGTGYMVLAGSCLLVSFLVLPAARPV